MKSKTSPILVSLFTITLTIGFAFFGSSRAYGQEFRELINNPNENTTLQEVKELAEEYYENRDKGKGSGYKQYQRWLYRMEKYVNPDGKFNRNFEKIAWDVARATIDNGGANNRSVSGWTEIGPTSVTTTSAGYNRGLGRINMVAFHPTDANIIYVGTPAGGIWKSQDGGLSWSPMSDMIGRIGVSGIAIHQTNPDIIYILTGDGDGAPFQGPYSIGILKSSDGGTTWNPTGVTYNVTDDIKGYRMIMHPTNNDIMYVVTTEGILKTTDGWNSFTNVQTGSFRDIEFKPGDPAFMYASTANSFFKSTDSGDSWSQIVAGLPEASKRFSISVSPDEPNYVYLLAGQATGFGSFRGMYRSVDSGDTFDVTTTTPNILGYPNDGLDSRDQASYDLALAVNPLDADNLLTGGINVWRSTDGGANLTAISQWNEPVGSYQYVHADIHDLAFNPLDNILYVCSDGGISKSTDNGVTWTTIWDGIAIMQFYDVTGLEANSDIIIGGTQDNGTNKFTGSGAIKHINGADGGGCMINYNTPDIIYSSWQGGGLWKSTDGGETRTRVSPFSYSGPFITKFEMDPNAPEIIYGGYYSGIRRSADAGATWTNIGGNARSALAIGKNDPARLYAAAGSTLQTTANTGANWNTITGPWPDVSITSITIDPDDATKVWITLGGYMAGEKVYHSEDAGANWMNVSGSLPNVPALSSDQDNRPNAEDDSIYVGMDVGVYFSSDTTPWQLYETGIPNVAIYDLEINETNRLIRAGTFGRGLWEAPLFTPITPDAVVVGTGIDDVLKVFIDGEDVVVTNHGVIELFRQQVNVTTSLTINADAGNDSLEVDFDGGDFTFPITYNGETQTSAPGDIMSLTGGTNFDTAEFTFVNENDGAIAVTGNTLITYTGLEPIMSSINATDVILSYSNNSQNITTSGGNGQTTVDSTAGEIVTFNNPSNSLTINPGTASNNVFIEGLGTGFDADFIVNGGANDLVYFQNNPTNAGTGDITLTGLSILVNESITTSGPGAINFTANRNILVENLATVSSQDGGITFEANSSGALSATQNFDAILIVGEVNTSGNGAIDLLGNGGSTGATDFNIGIAVEGANAKVETTGAGAITMIGTGGPGSSDNSGVMVSFGGLIAANGNAIDITGNGGSDGFGIHNIGVRLRVNGTISNTGAGTISLNGTGADNGNSNYGVQALGGSIVSTVNGEITLNGTGGNGAHANQGLRIEGAGTKITTIDGGITLNGTGGNATGNNNEGVTIILDALIEATGSSAINITGNAVSGLNSNKGVVFFNADMSSAGGGITINGTGGGTNNNNLGISIEGGSVIEDTLDGNISLTGSGAAGVDFNIGVDITGGSFIRINDGDISIMATGGNGTGNNNLGLRNIGGSIIEATGMGLINLVGQGGNGTDYNDGVRIENSSSVTATTGGINIQGIGATGSVGEANMGVNIASNSSIIASSTNNISIEGTGGSGTQFNRGIVFSFNSITSSGGNIDIIAQGGTGTGNFQVGLTAFPGTSINTNGAGAIGILGTGGVGPTASDSGIELIGTTQITSENGAITIDGVAVDGSIGNRIEATITATGTGDVILNGTTTSATQAAINILNDNTTITAGGNITATANIGKLNTPAEIPMHAIFEATNTIINGILAPGQSPGQLTVNGNFTMSSGDTAEIEINAITTPGTDYDQIKVTGTVDISDATLALLDNIPGVLVEGAEIVIIANDGVEPVVGIFDGLTTTTPIPFNDQFVFVHYDGGDGNDVSLVVDSMPTAICQDFTVQVDASGNVTILPSDIDNGSFDPDGPVTLSVSPDTFDCSAAGIPQIVTLTVTDNTGNIATCEATVTIEKRPTTLTYTGDLVEQYSDQVDLSATLVDIDGFSLEGKTVSFTIGTQSVSSLTDMNGVAMATLILTQDPNVAYTVETEFIEDDCYLGSTDSDVFDITQEDAIIAYTGQTLQATPDENTAYATVVLSANIQDITVTDFANDPFEGDIRNAQVKFVNRDNGQGISGWIPVANLIDPSDPTTGTVSYDWYVDLGNQTSETFTVGILVGSLDDNGYYLRDDSDDNTVITVYIPVGDFITGGGNIVPDNSAGQYASTNGLKTNFGFNVKFNAGGRRLKGHMNVIFRRLELDGVHTYQIKGNAIQSLGVDIGDPENAIAEFITKANLKDITDLNNPISLGGNLLLKADITDRGEPGVDDSIGLTLTTSNGVLLYSSNWTGIDTQEMVLAAGNIVVHSGFNTQEGGVLDTSSFDLFSIMLYPNPARSSVIIRNPNGLELERLAIYDLMGRLIKTVNLTESGTEEAINISELASATYMVLITTENGQVTKQLVKE